MLYNDDVITVKGLRFRVTFPIDDCHGSPWEECDGHGPVSKWTTRDKSPGERLLHQDRSFKRYYDFQKAVRIAKRDGWGFSGMTEADRATMSKGAIAVKAVEEDFHRLWRWCNDQWCYVGCVVTLLDSDDEETEASDSIWGIESDCHEYIEETAYELAESLAVSQHELSANHLQASHPDLYSSLI